MSAPIYITRHGQTDWNAEQRVQGQAETDINALGRRQAKANGQKLAQLVPDPSGFAFVASPMRRTRETMEIIRAEMGLPRDGYVVDPRLVEVHFGAWQGSTFAELERRNPGTTAGRDGDKWLFRPPGQAAESYAMLADRIRPWFESLTGPAIIVTHGGVIRTLFHIANGLAGNDAANMDVPQDRVLRVADGKVRWI
ncbi:MAG: histidine phosphatase family protein [Mesorhizobium sp.]|nr:histidine phosphatase family protein [Mesorhizobium sp.]